MPKITQKTRIAEALKEHGTIMSWAFIDERPRILRVGARIQNLRDEGWNIKGFWKDEKYYYKLISYPQADGKMRIA